MNSKYAVIVPIGESDGQLHELSHWMPQAVKLGFQIILVHDYLNPAIFARLNEICEGVELQSKIMNIRGSFGSPGAARNAGLSHVTAEWIAFWDSDDLPNCENFVQMVAEAEVNTCDVACGAFTKFDLMTNTPISSYKNIKCLNYTLPNPGLWRFAFKKSVIENRKFPDLSMGEDLVFLGNLGLESKQILFSQLEVYRYYCGSKYQLTNQKNSRKSMIDAITHLALIAQEGPRNSYSTQLLLKLVLSSIFSSPTISKFKAIKYSYVLTRKMSARVFFESIQSLKSSRMKITPHED